MWIVCEVGIVAVSLIVTIVMSETVLERSFLSDLHLQPDISGLRWRWQTSGSTGRERKGWRRRLAPFISILTAT